MLTKVTAFSDRVDLDPLELNIVDRPDSELFGVRDIQGLAAVKAEVNTVPFGSVDGAYHTGSSLPLRNIVFQMGFNPDWTEWTVAKLRRRLDDYFTPKSPIRLVFESETLPDVEISGIVESNEPTLFSKDPESQISIICPEPDFVSITPIVVEGSSSTGPEDIVYNGSVPSGFNLEIRHDSGSPTLIDILINYIETLGFSIAETVDATKSIELNTIPGNKYIRHMDIPGPTYTSILGAVQSNPIWPVLRPGPQQFTIVSDDGVQDWELTYFERFGSL